MTALDTNILIYACDARDADKQASAISLIESVADGVLLWQVACEFVAASRKLSQHGFTVQDAWKRLEEFVAVLRLITPSASVLERARVLNPTGSMQMWDAMLYAACIDSGVSRLYSEDVPGQAIPNLSVVNPFASA